MNFSFSVLVFLPFFPFPFISVHIDKFSVSYIQWSI
jgi:hypothetical protein